MHTALLLAAAVAGSAFLVHTFVGQAHAVRPLLAVANLPPASRWLNFLCWHIATLLLFAMTVVLALGAAGHMSADALWLVGLLALGISGLSILATRLGGIHPLRFPSTWLLGAVGVLTLWGLAAA